MPHCRCAMKTINAVCPAFRHSMLFVLLVGSLGSAQVYAQTELSAEIPAPVRTTISALMVRAT